jgi:glycerophosphoryl diester phosphodiesterase
VDSKNTELFEIHLKDLTLSQLRRLKLDHVSASRKMFPRLDREHIHEYLEETETEPVSKSDEAKRLLDDVPTLKELFENLPSSLGFNLEVKYPILEEDNQSVISCWEDKVILRVVFSCSSLSTFSHRMIMLTPFFKSCWSMRETAK